MRVQVLHRAVLLVVLGAETDESALLGSAESRLSESSCAEHANCEVGVHFMVVFVFLFLISFLIFKF